MPGPASATDATSAGLGLPDYGEAGNWLCLPGRADACTGDQRTTVVAADGTTTVEPFTADPDAPVDCFYIYPTVSMDEAGNSDMAVGAEETMSAEQQFARFASVCKLHAPMYRQVTLNARKLGLGGPAAFETAYGDVRSAWREYMAHRNGGRGVIVIAHSQGSMHLARLLRDEIAASGARAKLVSAYVIGWSLPVEDGDTFAGLPYCRSDGQTGCVINYVTFREDAPPPDDALFGHVTGDQTGDVPPQSAACTNPAALGGGDGELVPYLTDKNTVAWPAQPVEWVQGSEVGTPFVSLPGLLTARCIRNGDAAWLSITTHADPADPRTDAIRGDALDRDSNAMAQWGLHPVDMHLTMGNLVALARRQRDAWLSPDQ